MTDIGKLVAAQAREVAMAKDLHTGAELPVPERIARYRIVQFNRRQHNRTGFGIVRVGPFGSVGHLAMSYTTRTAAQAIVDAFNQWAATEA